MVWPADGCKVLSCVRILGNSVGPNARLSGVLRIDSGEVFVKYGDDETFLR